MKGISINAFKISLLTSGGEYGFECTFKSGLNIIRGDNSSGKSTLINSLIYSLGMEEILGGKGTKVLPYALKEYVEDENKNKVKITSSYVYVEIENRDGDVITLKRSITSEEKNSKLLEIIVGPYLSNKSESYKVIPTYLHDKGSANGSEHGFFSYLENFMSLSLPYVAGSNGEEVKLYLQTIFSSSLIEQKRGWTDYIANTPYYAIRDVKTKIVEFVLDFDVFENEKKKILALSELSEIQKKWSEERYKISLASESVSIVVAGIRESVDDRFDKSLVDLSKISDGNEVNIYSHIGELVDRVESIKRKGESTKSGASIELLDLYNDSRSELDKLLTLHDRLESDIRLSNIRLVEYKQTLVGIEDDLAKNKVALKLKRYGSIKNLDVANDQCPSCHQPIDDSLLLADTLVQPMSIEDNIKYLESQKKMVSKYISGLNRAVSKLALQVQGLSDDISEKRLLCLSLKKDLRSFDSISESDIRIKVQLEGKISDFTKIVDIISKSINTLKKLSLEYIEAKRNLSSIPSRKMSGNDIEKIKEFQKNFKVLAGKFGYKSASTDDIEINMDTLFPYLSGIELREVNTDIKSDSSASDFVRLIWAYILSMHMVSNKYSGNHFGIIIFDEPAQHSMGVTSVNELLKSLSIQSSLQGIVAASFDESDRVFAESIDGVSHNLIRVGRKLLSFGGSYSP